MSEASDVWAIVEIMPGVSPGHSRFAGRVSECQAFGAPLIRVEVPTIDGHPGFEKHFGASAIFAITPCDEAFAREAARRFAARPLALIELGSLVTRPALPRPDAEDDLDYGSDAEDY